MSELETENFEFQEAQNDLDIINKKTKKPRFNTLEALASIIGMDNVKLLTKDKVKNISLIGAKDSGKTVLVTCLMIYKMESDPHAHAVALRKYSNGAATTLGKALSRDVNWIKQHYELGSYRMIHNKGMFVRETKRGDDSKNQAVQLSSFDDVNKISGDGPINNGHIAILHKEEPAEQHANATFSLSKYLSMCQTLDDSFSRFTRRYNKNFNKGAPVPETLNITTSNGWDPYFVEIMVMEHYIPDRPYLMKMLAGLDPDDLLGNKPMVDLYWKKIKKTLVKYHTATKYIKDETIILEDPLTLKNVHWWVDRTLLIKKSKFANPSIREDRVSRDKAFREIYQALISGSQFQLARTLGTIDNGSDDEFYAYRFAPGLFEMANKPKDYPETRTEQWVRDSIRGYQENKVSVMIDNKPQQIIKREEIPKRNVLGFFVGMDVDTNRRFVVSPMCVTAEWDWIDNNGVREKLYKNPIVSVFPQTEQRMYGRPQVGEVRKFQGYVHDMDKALVDTYEHYYNNVFMNKRRNITSYCLIDEQQGSYMSSLINTARTYTNKGVTIRNGAWDQINRQNKVQIMVSQRELFIDHQNKELMEYYTKIPKNPLNQKRIQKDKFERMADKGDAMEAGLYPAYRLVRKVQSNYEFYKRAN